MNHSLKKWLENTLKDELWKNHNDLHIDDINAKYEERSKWIKAGIKCLREASLLIRDIGVKQEKVFLMFPLICNTERLGINFGNLSEFEIQLGTTPPSLYVYKEDWSCFVDTLNEGVLIDWNLFDSDVTTYYIEYREDGDCEFRRSVMCLHEDTGNAPDTEFYK